jgi:hypothetical protein
MNKSISPHFNPNNSLCRNPVDAARRTNVRSRSARPLISALISAGIRMVGGLPIAFLIGRDGRIRAKHIGATDISVFENEIVKLLWSKTDSSLPGS